MLTHLSKPSSVLQSCTGRRGSKLTFHNLLALHVVVSTHNRAKLMMSGWIATAPRFVHVHRGEYYLGSTGKTSRRCPEKCPKPVTHACVVTSFLRMRAGYPIPNTVDSSPNRESYVLVLITVSKEVQSCILLPFQREEALCVARFKPRVDPGGVL